MPFSALSNVFGSLIGASSQNRNIDKQIDAQSKENERTRKYNLQLAEKQNQWNIDQWNREVQYNDPAAQMARFKAAGLNPNLIYGQTNTAPQLSGSLTSGAPATPTDMSALGSKSSPLAAVFRSIGEQRMLDAQIRNIDAQTNKTEAETEGQYSTNEILATDAKFREVLNQGQIDLGNAQIRGIDSNIAKNETEISKMRQETVNLQHESDNLLAKYDEIRANIANIDASTAYTKLRGVLESQETQATVRKLAAETRLSQATVKSIVSKLPYELLGLQTNTQLTEHEIENLKKIGLHYDVETKSLEFDLGQAKDFDSWQRASSVWMFIINGLSSIATPIGIALGAGSPHKIKGFGRR